MLHLRDNGTIWNTELNVPYCTFPWLFLCLRAKNKENLSGAEGETWWFYFTYLLHAGVIYMQLRHLMLRHFFTTAAGCYPSPAASDLKQYFLYEWPISESPLPTFPWWCLGFFVFVFFCFSALFSLPAESLCFCCLWSAFSGRRCS